MGCVRLIGEEAFKPQVQEEKGALLLFQKGQQYERTRDGEGGGGGGEKKCTRLTCRKVQKKGTDLVVPQLSTLRVAVVNSAAYAASLSYERKRNRDHQFSCKHSRFLVAV